MADYQDSEKLLSRKDAIERGLKHFFTGIPCLHGHICKRYVSSKGCIACADLMVVSKEKSCEYARRYRLRAKTRAEQDTAYAEYYNELKERNKRSTMLWRRDRAKRAKHDEEFGLLYRRKMATKTREWRAKNPDKTKEIERRSRSKRKWTLNDRRNGQKYRNKNREKLDSYIAEWRRNNPEKKLAYGRNRKSRKRGANGAHTGQDIVEIAAAQKGRCAYCRVALGPRYHVDHIMPLAKGGSNDRRNLQILCKSCNSSKKALDPLDYARSLGRLI